MQSLDMPDLTMIRTSSPSCMIIGITLIFQLAITLLSTGKQMAVDTSVNVAALLQEQLTTFLLSPRVSLDRSHVEIMVTSASFISSFMSYHDQWQIQHPSSLSHLYHAMTGLIHIAVCFLIRPSYLVSLVSTTYIVSELRFLLPAKATTKERAQTM